MMDRQKIQLSGAPGHLNPVPQHKNAPPDFAMIIVMIIVLAIILIFCFWGAPGIRAYCRRKVCYRCSCDQDRERSGTPGDDRSATPTIILLPFGRMLVVDRTVITQLQTDQTGIDFMELSANLIRAHHLRYSSTPSILDSDTTSKGLSPISLGYSPPSYEDIFGEKNNDLPPSYSELSLLFRQRQMESNEMQSFNFGSLMATRNKETVQETVLVINEEPTRVQQRKDTDNSHDHVVISVPSTLDLPSTTDVAGGEGDDFSYPNCKYCIMSLGSDRTARIKCYCYEDSDGTRNECVLTTRSCEPNTFISTMVEENENYSECSAYTAERIAIERKDDLKNDVKNDSEEALDNGASEENYNIRTFSENSLDEETSKQTYEDIKESSL